MGVGGGKVTLLRHSFSTYVCHCRCNQSIEEGEGDEARLLRKYRRVFGLLLVLHRRLGMSKYNTIVMRPHSPASMMCMGPWYSVSRNRKASSASEFGFSVVSFIHPSIHQDIVTSCLWRMDGDPYTSSVVIVARAGAESSLSTSLPYHDTQSLPYNTLYLCLMVKMLFTVTSSTSRWMGLPHSILVP